MSVKTTTVMLMALLCVAWLVGCTDVPSTGPTPPDFNAEFRFFSATEDVDGVGVSVDGQSVGTLAYRGSVGHTQFPAGSRTVNLGSDSFPQAMATDERATVVIMPLLTTDVERPRVKLVERRIFDPAATSTAKFRFVNAVTDVSVDTTVVPNSESVVGLDVDITITASDSSTTEASVAYGASSKYINLAAGSYTVDVRANGATLVSESVSLSAIRQTSFLTGSAAAASVGQTKLDDN